jgi:hypothetical protein
MLASQFQGLDDLHGYLKYGNLVVKVKLPIMPRVTRAAGFVPRAPQPIEKRPLPDLEAALAQRKRDGEQAAEERRKAATAAAVRAKQAPKETETPAAAPVMPPITQEGTNDHNCEA